MYVVTGASGLIGGNLIRELIKQSKPVRAVIHKDHQALNGLDLEIVHADVLDLPSLENAFAGSEIVFHLAGMISIGKNSSTLMEAVNISGTANVMQACRQVGVKRLVHFSSIQALEQKPLDNPVNENSPLALKLTHTPYDRSKAMGELLVRKAVEDGFDAVIIAPTGVIGPFDFSPSHLGEALLLMANGKLPALVKGGFNWIDVRDLALGAITASESSASGSRYILGGHWRSVVEICQQVSKLTCVKCPNITLPLWTAYLGLPFINTYTSALKTRPLYTKFSLDALRSNHNIDISKAAKELNYSPRSFNETIADSIAWFQENQYYSSHKQTRN